MFNDLETLKNKISTMPEAPGAYLMKDSTGRVIYVGKAKVLPKRVASYFQKMPETLKTSLMVAQIADFEYIVTDNEKEALILENSLIKKHKPRYNIILRDDKTYPSLRLTVQEPWPRLEVVRRIQRDGAMYFGPFSSAWALRQTLRTIKNIFPLRQCRRPDPKSKDRPCLNYQLGRCSGVCTGQISQEEYRSLVGEVILFFKGRNKALTGSLKEKMREASDRLDFEAAAKYRDRLAAVFKTLENQKMVTHDQKDIDVIGLAQDRGQALGVILYVRRGALLGARTVNMTGQADNPDEIMTSMIVQYYTQGNLVPGEILIPAISADTELIQDWLREIRGRPVKLLHPQRGDKKKLLDLARENAATALTEKFRSADLGRDALVEIKQKLHLPDLPSRIEGYDMSTLRGDAPVGAMVVMEEGRWIKKDYRRFRIKSASGQDDYAMMSEVLGRRLSKDDLPRPDLILLDGGRGQLGVVLALIKDLELEAPPPLAGLAKGRDSGPDKVWLPGRKNPIDFKPDAPGLLLLMRIRDEAHRYVQDYHHRVRAKKTAQSVLNEIEGVGPARRKALLNHFKSIEAIKSAPLEELRQVKGLPPNIATSIYTHFHPGEDSGSGEVVGRDSTPDLSGGSAPCTPAGALPQTPPGGNPLDSH